MTKYENWTAPLVVALMFLCHPVLAEDGEIEAQAADSESSSAAETTDPKQQADEAPTAEAEVAAVEQPEEVDAPDSKIFCRTVKRVGSHRRVRVCRTADDIERTSREAEEFKDALSPGIPIGGDAGGG